MKIDEKTSQRFTKRHLRFEVVVMTQERWRN